VERLYKWLEESRREESGRDAVPRTIGAGSEIHAILPH
jgi:hypothetical protein